MLRSAARPRAAPTHVPARYVSRIAKAARLVSRDKAPHFTADGKRIFNVERHLFNVNKRIGWAAANGKPQEAMQTFAQLKANGLQPDIVSYTSLLKAFVTSKQWTEAETTFASISQGTNDRGCRSRFAANLKPNVYSYGHLLEALGLQGKTEQLLQTAENLRKEGFGTNERILQQLLVSLGQCKAKGEVTKVWEELKALKAPSRYSWNSYILALLRCGDYEGAEKAFTDMQKQQHMRPDRNTFLHLLGHLTQVGNAQGMTKALGLVAEMRRRSVSVTSSVHHLLMQGWLKLGDLEKALEHLPLMRKNNVFISPLTYHVLISGCVTNKLLPKADVLLYEMTAEAHLRPTDDTLKSLAAAHKEAGNAKRAEEVLAMLEVYKFRPAAPFVELTLAGAKTRVMPTPDTPQAATKPTAKV